jgi:hypothetical protein
MSLTFPTEAVRRQRDLMRGVVNGDAPYPCQPAAGHEVQFVAEL